MNGAAATTLAADLCEPTPAVSGLNPDHGNSTGGQVVKVLGSGLAFPRSVKFGTVDATTFRADSDSQITAVAPAGTAGTIVNVAVTTMGGTSVAGAGNQYTFFGPGPWEFAGGVLASGPIISLMDMATSMAIWMKLGRFRPQATLDLRVDYLRPATPRQRIVGRGECYGLTKSIAFVRGTAHDGDPDDLVAHVTGTFISTE